MNSHHGVNSNPPESDLEKRLQSILVTHTKTNGTVQLTDVIAQILTAIKDAGYIQKINDGFEKGHKAGYRMAELEYMAVGYVGHELKPGMLTGEEWYARFEKELLTIAPTTIEDWEFSGQEIKEAAKRAAGIDEL